MSKPTKKFDMIVIGGGAAGLFCAIEAGKRGRKALVIEHNAQVGRKILISGGGRCNFTNINTTPENFVSQNPHFCKSALARYTPLDFLKLVRKHGIEHYEKKLGQMFCKDSSRQIVEMLLKECEDAKVHVRTECEVWDVSEVKEVWKVGEARFKIETSQGTFQCESLVIATGGLSFAKVGATAFGYEVARQFGIKRVETKPGLVPLTMANGKDFPALAGVSIDSAVSVKGQEFRENILFTHRGMSGPAILQISNYTQRGKPISIDLLPETGEEAILHNAAESNQNTANFLGKYLPSRVAENFATQFPNKPVNKLNKTEIEKIVRLLKDWQVEFAGTEGYDKAEVTLGGVSTAELSSQTMEAKKVPGLYFIGEVVDVTGWLGGYNFQWAWASAYAAGQSV